MDGKDYAIDLSDDNAARLRDALAPFIGAARRPDGRGESRLSINRASADREYTVAARRWARENGHEIADRGRIPAAVLRAYDERNTAPVAAAKVEKSKKTKRVSKVATDPFATAAG